MADTRAAAQNRLGHTSNGLSPMAGNVQDAERAIRNTDEAEEAPAYAKNNRLIRPVGAVLSQGRTAAAGQQANSISGKLHKNMEGTGCAPVPFFYAFL